MGGGESLSERSVLLLAIASAIVTANAYYIHPIIGDVAESFRISDGLVGIVPALNQVALALGVFLVLPLGDRMSNRRIVVVCLSAQVCALVVMALIEDFVTFVIASSALGFFTITPYLLPAYASKRVAPQQLGFVTAVLTTGVVVGVQLSRVASGAMGEYLGWRSVYWLAAVLMGLSTLVLPLLMADEHPTDAVPKESYSQLIRSLLSLAADNPQIMISGLIQGLGFGLYVAAWMGISLHLTSDALNLGTDTVGYLAVFSVLGVLTTPRLGRWADRFGAERARLRMAYINFVSVACLAIASIHWLLVLLPIIAMSIAGPIIDVTGRMTGLNQAPAVRTRLMTLYITLMFLGGGLGSWSGTLAYDFAGWWGTVGLTSALAAVVVALAFQQARGRG